MLKKLLKRNHPSKGAGGKGGTPAASGESALNTDPYAEVPIEGAKVSLPGTDGNKQTLGDVEDPRSIIAQAIGAHALTLAKSNTVLKVVSLSLAALALVLGIMAAKGWEQETVYRYFFVSSDGKVWEREPLNAPLLSLNNVRDFYAESLSHLFSFHYRNFGDHYQRLAPDIMTERAMHEFASELDRMGLIDSMATRREVAEAVILQTPTLNASGEDPATGAYTWELTVPFNLRLESGRGEDVVRRMGGVARVQIIRVDPMIHPRQILINRITIRDTGNE